jgi:BBSome-interacting protein 1
VNGEMSLSNSDREVSFVFPKSGNLFYEKKKEYKFCKPILLPIKSVTLEKLEKMQLEAQNQMKVKTADSKDS